MGLRIWIRVLWWDPVIRNRSVPDPDPVGFSSWSEHQDSNPFKIKLVSQYLVTKVIIKYIYIYYIYYYVERKKISLNLIWWASDSDPGCLLWVGSGFFRRSVADLVKLDQDPRPWYEVNGEEGRRRRINKIFMNMIYLWKFLIMENVKWNMVHLQYVRMVARSRRDPCQKEKLYAQHKCHAFSRFT